MLNDFFICIFFLIIGLKSFKKSIRPIGKYHFFIRFIALFLSSLDYIISVFCLPPTAWVFATGPAEYVSGAANPLVSHDLPAEEDGTAAVQHGQVAGAVPPDVVPQHGRPGAGPTPDSQPGEDSEAASLDTGEVEHQGGHPVPGRVPVGSNSLHRLRYVVVVLVYE